MAGKHAAPSSGSKKPLIIIISIVLVLVIAGTGAFFILTRNRNQSQQTTATTAATAATTVPASSSAATAPSEQAPATTAAADAPQETTTDTPSHSDEPETTMDINIPTEEGSTVTYFNASYIPSGEVIDLETGESASLRDVFGATYPGGVLTFNDDGTFTDTIGSTGVDSGEYLVENGEVKATYIYDRNMNITVLEWNEETKTPRSFYIVYGNGEVGYQVYFSEN